MKKTSEAQRRASKKWDDANKEKKRRIIMKSMAKKYILTATEDEIKEIEGFIAESRKNKSNAKPRSSTK